MIRRLLDAFGEELCQFLAEMLPRIETDWWIRCVVARLTFQQQNFVRSSGTATLAGLDVAALMRVMDQNWHEIVPLRNLAPASRTWLKEAQTIRNRWAHAPAGGLEPEETYRDLDTLERFLSTIGAKAGLLEEIRLEKKSLLGKLSGGGGHSASAALPTLAAAEGAFARGSVVRLKARPTVTGAVIDHVPGAPEDRYVVFNRGAPGLLGLAYLKKVEPAEAKVAVRDVTTPQAIQPTHV